MAVEVPIDVNVLRDEIRKTYSDVSAKPDREFIFPTGREWALALGYPEELLRRVPAATVEAFAGVANPFSLGPLEPGERVLDVGSGAGMDAMVAAQMVGPSGHVTGVDMTPDMVAVANRSAGAAGFENVEFVMGMGEDLPVPDASVDVVISNGVIDLMPDKDAVFSEIERVLKPGGRLQIADVVIQREVSEEGKRNIDLWTG